MALKTSVRNLVGDVKIGETLERLAAEVVSTDSAPPELRHESRQAFLESMRQVATSVTVVTTDGPAGRHGATVSAFSSVSADPPTVLVCLRSDSRICSAARLNRVFTVSVLTEQLGEVARTFAGEFDTTLADRFDGIDIEPLAGLAPGIQGASIFACIVAELIERHTHTILLGHVVHVATVQHPPLLYHCAAYKGVWPGEGFRSA